MKENRYLYGMNIYGMEITTVCSRLMGLGINIMDVGLEM